MKTTIASRTKVDQINFLSSLIQVGYGVYFFNETQQTADIYEKNLTNTLVDCKHYLAALAPSMVVLLKTGSLILRKNYHNQSPCFCIIISLIYCKYSLLQYGGDITRKMKLLRKQRAGKVKLKLGSNIVLSKDAFLTVVRKQNLLQFIFSMPLNPWCRSRERGNYLYSCTIFCYVIDQSFISPQFLPSRQKIENTLTYT